MFRLVDVPPTRLPKRQHAILQMHVHQSPTHLLLFNHCFTPLRAQPFLQLFLEITEALVLRLNVRWLQ